MSWTTVVMHTSTQPELTELHGWGHHLGRTHPDCHLCKLEMILTTVSQMSAEFVNDVLAKHEVLAYISGVTCRADITWEDVVQATCKPGIELIMRLRRDDAALRR